MKVKLSGFFFLMVLTHLASSAFPQSLRVGEDGRHLVRHDGTAFFWLGDTAWELFHRLPREEADLYLARRASQGFTVVQAVVLAEFDGLTVPNAYGATPLLDNDPSKPDAAYFEHVDYIVNKAASFGLVIGILPTWGDKFNRQWGVGPEIFTPENATVYGEFLGARYRNSPVVWILGGDRVPQDEEDYSIIRAMAEGLRRGDQGRHLITYHPQGGASSSDFFQGEKWLDFNMFQSGHGRVATPNYQTTLRVSRLRPLRPVLDGEPNYEDHPINWNPANGWFDDFDSRRAGYWSMLSGAMGHTYGNHNVWQMWRPDLKPISWARTTWRQALDYPGAFQAGYMRRLFESRTWWLLRPDPGRLRQGPNGAGKDTLVATVPDGTLVVVYTPFGSPFKLSLEGLAQARLHAWWFNPRDATSIDGGNIEATGEMYFDPPGDERRGNDWVLVLDADPTLGPPGSRR